VGWHLHTLQLLVVQGLLPLQIQRLLLLPI
jgi:hypothetical protein